MNNNGYSYLNLFSIDQIINELFLAYKARKNSKALYVDEDANSNVPLPSDLIRLYYSRPRDEQFVNIKKAFITSYVNNESSLEDIHNKDEIDGLKEMYDYIHNGKISDPNYDLSYYDLDELNRKLFFKTSHPELAGKYRTIPAYLPGTGTELCPADMIRREMYLLDKEMIQPLVKIAREINNCDIYQDIPKSFIARIEDIGGFWGEYTNNQKVFYKIDAMLAYLDAVVVLGCKMIKIHPYNDGNGRAIRGFINKMLEDVGFPPIYIKVNERTEYDTAMNIANREKEYNPDYSTIKQFYRYKICDSIVELDINGKTRNDYNKGINKVL